MGKKDWSTFRAALAGGLIGAMLMAALPAVAATDGNFILGRRNGAGSPTKLISANGITTMRITNAGGVAPLDLVAKPGVPPMKVNTSAWVKNLNADLLDGRQANQLVRLAHAHSANVDEALFGGGASADILTTTIETPTAGFLHVTASVTVSGTTYDDFFCEIEVGATTTPGSTKFGVVDAPGGTHTSGYFDICATNGVTMVPAGTHTVKFHFGNRASADLDDAALSVIFIPYGATGAVGSP